MGGDRAVRDGNVAVDAIEGVDNFFEGAAVLQIEGGPVAIRMAGQDMAGFHIYVPPGEAFFCVEPVSHAPNSFGRGAFAPGDILAPGESREWRWTIGAA